MFIAAAKDSNRLLGRLAAGRESKAIKRRTMLA